MQHHIENLSSGYITLTDYLDDLSIKNPWQIPIQKGDFFHILFLRVIRKISWFSPELFLFHPSITGPRSTLLATYLKKRGLLDRLNQQTLHTSGFFCFSLEKRIFVDGIARSITGHGVSRSKEIALSKAFGEMLERSLSGAFDTNKSLLIASPDELMIRSPVLYPPKYHRFLDVQRKEFSELVSYPSDQVVWVEGKNIITNKKTYLPRQITSWLIKNHNEAPLFNATSSGCAGYFTKTGAVLRGLLEVIQRDAFLVHWLTQIAPDSIKGDTLLEETQKMIKEFKSRGISLYILDVTSLSIPSVVVVAINAEASVPQVVVSASSATTFKQAIEDGLREMAISAEMFYYPENKSLTDVYSEPFISPLGQIGRQLFWRGSEKIKQFQWFLSGKQVSYGEICKKDLVTGTDDTAKLKACLAVLKERGPDYYPIVYFPKHPIQKKLGFYIAQVYVPKAFPLYLLEYQGTFDSDRLQEFAESKGVTRWELNRMPHMFP